MTNQPTYPTLNKIVDGFVNRELHLESTPISLDGTEFTVVGDVEELNGITLSVFWVADVVTMIHAKGHTVAYESPTPHASFNSHTKHDLRTLCGRLSFGMGLITLAS